MIYIYPDFYFDFECKAGNCTHTCCKDWEIDVDEDSLSRFSSLLKAESNSILKNIAQEGTSHIILHEDGNCPFLENSGLCVLIKNYGEDFVPYICREHPRFYNEYESYCECGLGLSCEKTAELLADENFLDFIFQDDGEDAVLKAEEAFIDRKYNLIEDISDSEDILKPIIAAYSLPNTIDTKTLINAFSDIETLSGKWHNMLKKPEFAGNQKQMRVYADVSLRAFSQYLVFRHLTGENDNNTALFITCSVMLCSLLIENGNSFEDVIREFSSEIEYSDENIGRIITALHS